MSRPPPAHRLTTAHLGAAYPFVAEGGLGTPGVYVGRDLLGGAFSYDPFALYASGALTNPNMVVMGQIGRGKSALVKSYLWRQAAFGRGAWIVDPKGEYGVLGRLHGVARFWSETSSTFTNSRAPMARVQPGVRAIECVE